MSALTSVQIGETASNGTNAVVTPLNLTTSEPSVVLDASASTSASGSLQYIYKVVAGGKVPVDFVSGAGLNLVQLTVTDVTGAMAKSPVVMLNYQPSGTTSGAK